MKNSLFVLCLLTLTSCAGLSHKPLPKTYVVQRERESLYVLDGNEEKTITSLGNLNHATMKFDGIYGYVLARDGYLSKIDTVTDQLIKKS